jgi:hypothetical protein
MFANSGNSDSCMRTTFGGLLPSTCTDRLSQNPRPRSFGARYDYNLGLRRDDNSTATTKSYSKVLGVLVARIARMELDQVLTLVDVSIDIT